MVLLMTLFTSCDADTSITGITWSKKFGYTLFPLSCVMNTMVLLTMSLALHDAYASANSVRWLKRSYYFSFWTNEWNGAIGDVISGIWCQNWHHTTKSHVAPCFNQLDLKNKMVPLTMPSVSCAADTGASCIWTKESYHTLFQLSPHNKNMPQMMQLASHDSIADINGITWLKGHVPLILIIVT